MAILAFVVFSTISVYSESDPGHLACLQALPVSRRLVQLAMLDDHDFDTL